MAGRVGIFVYGVVAYVLFLASFLYAIGFLDGQIVPKTIDSGEQAGVGFSVLIDVLLLGLFAVQHSVMARPAFKKWWTTIVPETIERSTYVLATSLVLFLIYWQWKPLPQVIWSVENSVAVAVIYGLFWLGWLIALVSTFLIDHFHLFGLKQTYYHLMNKKQADHEFLIPLFYRYVRHPLMVGFIMAIWAGSTMSAGRLLFAGVVTVYILIAIQIEERDLVSHFGDQYREYQRQTPMIIPWRRPPKV